MGLEHQAKEGGQPAVQLQYHVETTIYFNTPSTDYNLY